MRSPAPPGTLLLPKTFGTVRITRSKQRRDNSSTDNQLLRPNTFLYHLSKPARTLNRFATLPDIRHSSPELFLDSLKFIGLK
jgi:hypothetical protein